MNNYKISFICLCYNQENSIIKLIESIKNSKINYEIIVIDDHSTDNSILNIQKYKDVKLIINNKNLNNQSYSRNQGVNIATGDYIMYMDGDDYYESQHLNNLYNFINKQDNPEIIFLPIKHITSDNNVYYTTWNFSDNEYLHSVARCCISKHFLDRNNIKWDEHKYYVDSEDCYYFFNLLFFLKRYAIYSDYVAITIQGNNNNSKIKYKKNTYIDYINQMCDDLILLACKYNCYYYIEKISNYRKNEYERWCSLSK